MKIFDWLDGIEVTVVATVAALLLVLGPLFITYRFALAPAGEFWVGIRKTKAETK
jgi:hypothetical protein